MRSQVHSPVQYSNVMSFSVTSFVSSSFKTSNQNISKVILNIPKVSN